MATLREKLRSAFSRGTLKVQSVSPSGEVTWKRVLGVHRSEIGPEPVRCLTTSKGSSVMTAGHRVFLTAAIKVEAERVGTEALGLGGSAAVVSNVEVESRHFMYDLTAEDWHNFSLRRSGLVVSNSPDRNYHFRPPTHEETIRQYSRVFGFVWEDDELVEYLESSKDMISLAPPLTPFGDLDSMCSQYPAWKTLLITGGMFWALQALRINWIQEEFSYSIGGVSLDLDRSSKYESAASSMSEQFDKMLEKAKATVNVVRGLQQPRYGMGIRSAFGPYSGRGILSPRRFLGL